MSTLNKRPTFELEDDAGRVCKYRRRTLTAARMQELVPVIKRLEAKESDGADGMAVMERQRMDLQELVSTAYQPIEGNPLDLNEVDLFDLGEMAAAILSGAGAPGES